MTHRNEITGVQMLRGFCAAVVVLDHAAGMIASPKYGGQRLPAVLAHGFLGVDIFFVISGFIITIVALRGPRLRPAMSATGFFEKRFTRIVPLMWLAILSYALLQFAFARTGIDYAAYGRAMVLFPYAFLKPDVIWTLRQEFLFYLVFGLSFFGARPARLLMLAWVLAPFAYVASLGSWTATTAFVDSFPSVAFSACNLEFGAGLLLGIVWVKTAPASDLRLPLHPFVVIGLGVAAIVTLGWALRLVGQTLPTVLLAGVLGAALVGLAARSACPPGRLTRFGRLFGDASYSIYLFHSHVLAGLLAIRARLHVAVSGAVLLPATVAVVFAACIALHLSIEKPLIRVSRNLFGPLVRTPSMPVAR